MKRILINATQREELRVAIVDGQKLSDLDIETAAREQKKGNVYKGRITRVEPSLEACFVEYGAERHGFLPAKEIVKSYFKGGSGNLREQLQEGQEVIVQVEKEERGNKGAALTTYISLAGRYLVLMPNNPRAGGVSRRAEGDEREEAKEALDNLDIPSGMGVIIRSNGVGKTVEELQWDANYLADIWAAIEKAAAERKAPFLIYQENNIILRALRDYLRPDIGEVMIDSEEVYEQARTHLEHVMPQHLPRLKLYKDEMPLFSRFQIESQIELAHERTIRLPSGGSIVIDHTEALTAVDINSAKATGGGSIEDTAFNTNLEAADEVARQLRLRDHGGLIVIDFIDMNSTKNQREVEKRLENAVEMDRARIQIGRISRFGLLELSRQRLRPSLGEHTQIPCPRCNGRGQIRSVESLSLSILRLIEEEAMKDRTGRIIAQVPVDVGTFLLNEKRLAVREIEARCRVHVAVVPNPTMHTPHYEIRRVRADHLNQDNNSDTSYTLAQNFDAEAHEEASRPAAAPRALPEAAVKQILPSAPAPIVIRETVMAPTTSGEGFWAKVMRWLGFGNDKTPEEPKPSLQNKSNARRNNSNGRGDRRGDQRGDQRRDQRRGGNDKRRDGARDGDKRRDAQPQGGNKAQQQQPAKPRDGAGESGGQPQKPQRQQPRRDDRANPPADRQQGPQQKREEPRRDAEAPKPVAAVPVEAETLEAAAPAAGMPDNSRPTGTGEGREGGGRRRRRGGRGRGRRDREATAGPGETDGAADSLQAPTDSLQSPALESVDADAIVVTVGVAAAAALEAAVQTPGDTAAAAPAADAMVNSAEIDAVSHDVASTAPAAEPVTAAPMPAALPADEPSVVAPTEFANPAPFEPVAAAVVDATSVEPVAVMLEDAPARESSAVIVTDEPSPDTDSSLAVEPVSAMSSPEDDITPQTTPVDPAAEAEVEPAPPPAQSEAAVAAEPEAAQPAQSSDEARPQFRATAPASDYLKLFEQATRPAPAPASPDDVNGKQDTDTSH
ncbi:Rne/Rng family ribonuclease [Sinimarinibacterium sp. CAU 1509]|uniref:Rne/Rng family ribonuclease n=1 Tax=Sinimarinibacterium sp. CAU 1509 TaxID=2562283 RepID=UPI0010AC25BC|nr:Rne/Rng family ribonuclease [Sinimarinibacterium sp. CAU 1509]TJY61149.1 Rne/Rng family ribonuclease [Sinimarinibacterium sp. CAU 1509]